MYKIILVLLSSIFILPIYGIENLISDANIDITVNYPDVVIQGNEFILSTMVKAKSDQISNITLSILSPELEISQNKFHIQNLLKDSSLGNNFNIKIPQNSPDGKILANVLTEYYIKGFFDENPIKNSFTKAIELNIQSEPIILLDFNTPDSVFYGEPFSIKGIIKNQGSDAKNIKITIYSNQDSITDRKTYSLTNLDAGEVENFEFILQTRNDLTIPTEVNLNVSTSFYDMQGKEFSSDDSLNVFARQRGVFEIGSVEGIRIGDFFIAPVVGVGTIVSSVIGFLIFLWHLKNKKKKKGKKKSVGR